LEVSPSLRIDKPFPSLLSHALSLDFDALDVTDHGHVPYVHILVRVLHDWRQSHGGQAPKTAEEKKAFKALISAMRKKSDEENFDEAEAQAYKCWTETVVPGDIKALFKLEPKTPATRPFHLLIKALEKFTEQVGALPLSATLPDMKADTKQYVGIQRLYKDRAGEEKQIFTSILREVAGEDIALIDEETIDAFVKNSHILRLLKGKKWGWIDEDKNALAEQAQINPKQLAIHLALSALSSLHAKHLASSSASTPFAPTLPALTQEATEILPPGVTLDEEHFDNALGEAARSPTADLPNTAALLGGVVAQEVIKMITKQYVPIDGYCVVDLVETWTGMIN